MRSFFSADGPLFRAMSELVTLLLLNVLTIICSIPVVTCGAALASLHYCIMKMVDDEDTHVASMYFEQFKGNLKSVTPAWLVFLGFGAFLYFDYKTVGASEGGAGSIALILIYAAFIVYLALYVWFFPLAARFENGFGAKFKNSFLMAVGALPRTAAMMIIWAVLMFIFMHSYRLLPIFVLLGISFPAYLSSIFYYPVIKAQIEKQEIDPADESAQDDYIGNDED